MQDRYQRTIEYVRISVTDRCNLRCRYCMPEQGVEKMCHADILRFDEILRVIRALSALGVRKVRLTGGEPLVRKGILDLIREIRRIKGIEVISLTTNGVLLPEMAAGLRAAGLDSVNVSLDSLDEETFFFLTRRPLLSRVEEGLRALEEAGFQDTKINCVPLAGVNEADVLKLAELARVKPLNVRYIELMPVGCAYEAGLRGMPMAEVRRRLQEAFGAFSPVRPGVSLRGPAEYVQPAGFAGKLGFIDAMGQKFCQTCNRVRLTAGGFLKLCLHAGTGLDVRELLRAGIDDRELLAALSHAVYNKPAEHHFLEPGEKQDSRYMYQVGG